MDKRWYMVGRYYLGLRLQVLLSHLSLPFQTEKNRILSTCGVTPRRMNIYISFNFTLKQNIPLALHAE